MQLSLKDRIVYAEVMQVLKYFDRDLVMKIPIEIFEYFKENQDDNYVSKIDEEDIFNKNNISREALAIIAYFDLTYWANDEEKKTLKELYTKNEYSNKQNDYNDILENKEIDNNEDFNNSKNVQLIEYKESILHKLINKIKIFFTKK